jgi:hypothetical protein
MERLRILGEIPLRKFQPDGRPVLDPEGNPDTSFLAKIPADTPFTFQTLDRNGMVLNMAQTWHQVRPGEVRTDCGGCHAHSQAPLAFVGTAAGRPGYPVVDLTTRTPLLTKDAQGQTVVRVVPASVVSVEFYRDIRPILQRSCVPCHTRTDPDPPGRLVLDDVALVDGGLPGDYARLANDPGARWGYPPVVRVGPNPAWRQTNASRYVRMFQSRRSLLIWKLFGQRLDGWTNERHPTETVLGDPATLPPGADPNEADLDLTGTIMPPPGSGVPPLSEDEKLLVARWIDLGCPVNYGPSMGAIPRASIAQQAYRCRPSGRITAKAVASPENGYAAVSRPSRTTIRSSASSAVKASDTASRVRPGRSQWSSSTGIGPSRSRESRQRSRSIHAHGPERRAAQRVSVCASISWSAVLSGSPTASLSPQAVDRPAGEPQEHGQRGQEDVVQPSEPR